jgi:hypothetical protein
MSTELVAPLSPTGSLPIAPTEEEWRAMSPSERKRLLVRILDVLSDARAAKVEQAASKVERAEAKADENAARADRAIAALRAGILTALDTRGIAATDDLRARVLSCDEPATLQRWLLRALEVTLATEIFSADEPS